MTQSDLLKFMNERLQADIRASANHKMVFCAITRTWKHSKYQPFFTFYAKDLLKARRFKTIRSVKRYITDLNNWGYIQYFEGTGPNKMGLVRFPIIGEVKGSLAALRQNVGNDLEVVPKHTQLPKYGTEMFYSVWLKFTQALTQILVQWLIAWINDHFKLL